MWGGSARQAATGMEDVEMSASVVEAGWIQRLVDDERKRDSAAAMESELIARKAELVRINGRRLVDELRATVTRDVKTFRAEFAGDRARDVVVEGVLADGGFVVRKPTPGAVSLTVTPNLEAGALVCDYSFTLPNGLPPREDRISVSFAGGAGETLQMKHYGTGAVFATADALSEFLLIPVLTGRPR
jgi:hypothetical protein